MRPTRPILRRLSKHSLNTLYLNQYIEMSRETTCSASVWTSPYAHHHSVATRNWAHFVIWWGYFVSHAATSPKSNEQGWRLTPNNWYSLRLYNNELISQWRLSRLQLGLPSTQRSHVAIYHTYSINIFVENNKRQRRKTHESNSFYLFLSQNTLMRPNRLLWIRSHMPTEVMM